MCGSAKVLTKTFMHKGIIVDCAAGQAKFRDFILVSDEYFVAISQLYGITQHALSIWQSLLWKGIHQEQ